MQYETETSAAFTNNLSYPLIRASASRQHEDVLHLPLLRLLFNFATLLLGNYVIPFWNGLLLELWSALFHTGEIGHLH